MPAISSTDCINFRETNICLLVNFLYRVHKSQALVRNVRQINLNSHPQILFKIYFNITVSFIVRLVFLSALLVFPIPPTFPANLSILMLSPLSEFFRILSFRRCLDTGQLTPQGRPRSTLWSFKFFTSFRPLCTVQNPFQMLPVSYTAQS